MTVGEFKVARTQVMVSTEVLRNYLKRKLGYWQLPFRASTVGRFCEVVALWHSSGVSHYQATQLLRSLPLGNRVIWETLMNMGRISMAVGLFGAAERFIEEGWRTIDSLSQSSSSATFILSVAKQLIYQGRTEESVVKLSRLRSLTIPSTIGPSLHTVGWCLRCIHGLDENEGDIGKPSFQQSSWREYVFDRDVLIVGPGQIAQLPPLEEGFRVIRILGKGTLSWDDPDDPLENRVDAVYSNPENFNSRANCASNVHAERLAEIPFINLKKRDILSSGNSRAVQTFSPLFTFGHPLMVPLAILDVLVNGGRPVVIGADFFIGEQAYRPAERRRQDGRVASASGSILGDFDRSALMASHHIVENWMLIRNLADVGVVRGDEHFARSMAFSRAAVMSNYDRVIGRRRI